jgi:phosphopantothenoylcysteine decarboxylase/phosphopantothenate--cysteine ligase
MLKGKNILLCVCGSIANYKSAEITRLFVKAGANVKVIMTKDAAAFITPLTLSTLSKNPVYINYYKEDTGEWNNHVDLALWADVALIAPATANTMAKLANGICDNLLSAVYLSAKCLVYFAPAMDLDMWKHPSTQNNLQKLLSYGNIMIKPENGELASGLFGEGRMAEPLTIFETITNHFSEIQSLKGKRILITAGPTYEAIDPVRFIGNHSSGKMGFAIAEHCAKLGAEVILVCGPTSLNHQHSSIKRIDVISAEDMYIKTTENFDNCDICIMSAAVADYTPTEVSDKKIKKKDDLFNLSLKKTKDIASQLGKLKNHQILVGFALETDNEEENAWSKLERKNLDFIVLNSLNDEGAGFKGDNNKITIIKKDKQKISYDLKSKEKVAKDIIDNIIEIL